MAVYAVVGCVDLAAGEPFPERGIAGIEHGAIGLEPGQHVRVRLEAVGKPVEAELVEDARVPHVRLCLELLRGLRSEEHTSELQSQSNLVCRLLLEKKKKT